MGAEVGAKAYETFIGMVAASSPQTRTPVNAKIASHYYQRDRQGEKIAKGDPIPPGYGHYVQKNHQENARTIQDLGKLDSKQNPKIESYRNNLLGNLRPLTADIHNSRAMGLVDAQGRPLDTPSRKDYAFLERPQQERAEKMGLMPAEYQEGAWVGAGDITNLRSPPDPFLKVFEDRVALTADKMGLPKEQVLRRMVRGEIPLHTFVNPVEMAKQVGQNPDEGPSNDDGYKPDLIPLNQVEQAGMPAFSKPASREQLQADERRLAADARLKKNGGKIKLEADVGRDFDIRDLPTGYSYWDDGSIRDAQGKPAQFQNPGAGDVASMVANSMQPAGPIGAAAKAVAGGAHAGSATLGVGPTIGNLGGRLKQAEKAIPGAPETVKIPGEGTVAARPIVELQDAADSYMKKAGRPGEHAIDKFKDFDEDKARRIAEAYEAMQHAPNDPAVRRAYDAMIEETMGQYRALKDLGLEFKANQPGVDPYAASPAMGYADLLKNGRLNFFPTEQGYGTVGAIDDNPLLKRVGPIGDLQNATANDAFRVVHDAFGHFAPGNPFFRHKGEERAWQAHKRMYSPEAAPAMTAETRGQNSWLNFGPHGEKNRTAASAETVYADQKSGLMPSWTMIPALAAAVGIGTMSMPEEGQR
jgi:hypothetical protein